MFWSGFCSVRLINSSDEDLTLGTIPANASYSWAIKIDVSCPRPLRLEEETAAFTASADRESIGDRSKAVVGEGSDEAGEASLGVVELH